jgi:3-oxoacyl-(acyl-carrier-protein) synthase
MMEDSAIIKLFTDLSGKMDAHGTATRATIMAESEVINTNHNKLVKSVSFWIWAQKNYKFAVPLALIILILIIRGSDRIDLEGTFENTTKIELTE